ncbi:hypothetical protein EV1_032182 [Malus domestica]
MIGRNGMGSIVLQSWFIKSTEKQSTGIQQAHSLQSNGFKDHCIDRMEQSARRNFMHSFASKRPRVPTFLAELRALIAAKGRGVLIQSINRDIRITISTSKQENPLASSLQTIKESLTLSDKIGGRCAVKHDEHSRRSKFLMSY